MTAAPTARNARIDRGHTRVEKAGYKHFMAKEIAEQPAVIADALRSYIRGGSLYLRGFA